MKLLVLTLVRIYVRSREKKKLLQWKMLNLFMGDAMELPFEDQFFDYVTIGFGLRNVPDYLVALKK